MKKFARILTDCEDGFLKGKKYLIHDRDPLYKTDGFHDILGNSGVEVITSPPIRTRSGDCLFTKEI